jgi:CDP-diacylglycerol--serine O-phosphatidyltransferase
MDTENNNVPDIEQDSEDSLFPIDEHEEVVSEGGKKFRRRGIYLLPNILTLGALFAGFYAIRIAQPALLKSPFMPAIIA